MKDLKLYVALLSAGMITLCTTVHADTTGGSAPSAAATSTTVVPLHFSSTCPRGGNNTMDGSYDTVSGQVSITATVTGCTMWNGEVQDGSTTISGSLVPGNGNVVNINLTTADNSTVTRNNAKVTNTCTVTKNGAFDQGTRVFTGQNTSTCSMNGAVRDDEGLVEYLLRRAQVLSSTTATTTTTTTTTTK